MGGGIAAPLCVFQMFAKEIQQSKMITMKDRVLASDSS